VNFTGFVLHSLSYMDYPLPLFEKGNMYVCMETLLMKVTSSDQGIDGWVILVLTGNELRVDYQWFHDFIGIVVRRVCFRVDNLSTSLSFSWIDQDTPLRVLQNTVFYVFFFFFYFACGWCYVVLQGIQSVFLRPKFIPCLFIVFSKFCYWRKF